MIRFATILLFLGWPFLLAAQKVFRQTYHVKDHHTTGGVFAAKSRDGNLLVSSTCRNAAGWNGPVLFKVDATDGHVIWAKKPAADGENLRVTAMQTGRNGEVLLTGTCQTNNMLAENRPFMMLFTETGQLKWAMQFDFFILTQHPKAVFLSDNSIVFAAAPSNTLLTHVMMCKVTDAGLPVWIRHLDYSVPYTSGTMFRDIIPDAGGGFLLCTANNYGSNGVRTGVVHCSASGDVIKSINLGTVTGDDLFIGAMTGSANNLMLAARMGHSVCTVKLNNLETVGWQSSPLSIGFSVKDFAVSEGAFSGQSFLYGTHEKTDLGFEDLCLLRMDSMLYGHAALISVPDHTLDSWNGSITAIDETLFLPGTIKHAASSYPEMLLTAVASDFKGCEPYSDQLLTGVFSTLIANPYPVFTKPDNDNRSPIWMILLQDDVLVDTNRICMSDHFTCKAAIGLGADTVVCTTAPVVVQAPVHKGYRYRWSTADTTTSISITQSGTYSLVLLPPPGFGCDTLYDTIAVAFIDIPAPGIIATAIDAWPGETITFSLKGNAYDSVKWISGATQNMLPVYEEQFAQNGKYRVKVHAWLGPCMASDSIDIRISGYSVFVPNVFTPGNDHLNELFGPRGKGITFYRLHIYNRWGALIHSSENEGWNGQGVVSGTYIYTMEVRNDKGETRYLEGKVELLR